MNEFQILLHNFGLLTSKLTNAETGEFVGYGVSAAQMPLYLALVVLTVVIGYFLGCFNTALILSRRKYHEDIRAYGSGNAGMTNILRTYGKKAAAITLVGDMLKAALAVFVGAILTGELGAYAAGFFCLIGHCFPAFFGFKGGKGVAVTAAVILCLNPLVFLILLIFFVLTVLATKFLSLASIISVMVYPILLNRLYSFTHGGLPESGSAAVFSILSAAVVVFLHRENIKRLMEGTEHKFSLRKTDRHPKDEPAEIPAPEEYEPAPRSEKPNPNTSKKKQKRAKK